MDNELDDIFEGLDDLDEDMTEEESETTDSQGSEDTTDSRESDEEQETEEAGEEKQEETITFKHLGNDKALSKQAVDSLASQLDTTADDLVKLLQKGSDYDFVKGKNTELSKYEKINSLALDFAARNGLDPTNPEETLEAVFEFVDRSRIIRDIREQNPNMTEDVVMTVAQERLNSQKAQAGERQRELSRQQEEAGLKPWIAFFQNHKELSTDTLPKQVIDGVQMGLSPEEAYQGYVNAELRRELEESKRATQGALKAKENKGKEVGSLSSNTGDNKKDLFSEAFDSVFD